MKVFALSFAGGWWLAGALLLFAVWILYLIARFLRRPRGQRRDQRLRERQRQQFWGYE